MLVTGGAGFIGSHCVDLLLERGMQVTVVDNLTYAGSLLNLAAHEAHPRFRFVRADVTDPERVETRSARPSMSSTRLPNRSWTEASPIPPRS